MYNSINFNEKNLKKNKERFFVNKYHSCQLETLVYNNCMHTLYQSFPKLITSSLLEMIR